MRATIGFCVCAVVVVGCQRLSPTEQKFIGQWTSCSMDACALYAFVADHSFTLSLWEGNRPDGELIVAAKGKWRVDHNELVMDTQETAGDEGKGIERWKFVELKPDKLIFAGDNIMHRYPKPNASNQALERTNEEK
jgi:hypothetical protein